MKNKDEWIGELTEEIVRLKGLNLKSLYLISAEMTTDIATAVVKHFEELGHLVESKKCASCVNKYDLIIFIKND